MQEEFHLFFILHIHHINNILPLTLSIMSGNYVVEDTGCMKISLFF